MQNIEDVETRSHKLGGKGAKRMKTLEDVLYTMITTISPIFLSTTTTPLCILT